MRLLFLNSSLEPGRDGVGDYVRLLAGECQRYGHSCAIIALHDRHITVPDESVLNVGTGKIPLLRLPAASAWPERMGRAVAFRSWWQPDWISLQFVSYGFNDKGVVLNLKSVFQAITADCPLHIMFHELWLGEDKSSPFRHRLIGGFQRHGIRRLVAGLKPQRLSTSNPAYAAMLRSIEIEAAILPLFGNIPISTMDSTEPLPTLLADAGIPREGVGRNQWWLGLFFGGLYSEWKAEPLMSTLLRAVQQIHKRICLVLAGRPGAEGEAIWETLQRDYRRNIVLVKVGEQPAETISALMQIADFGISASPWQLIGKSGTAAAMLDHGLPVILSRDDFQPRIAPELPPSTDPLFHLCDASLESKLLVGLRKSPPRSRLGEITAQFCRLLESPRVTA
ncbi:MAG: glycosyltransferase [Methylacidiphilales bacterium]|nr:glycosyltransferase [Candidatus Methylacidiphilales bacterium]